MTATSTLTRLSNTKRHLEYGNEQDKKFSKIYDCK